MRTFVLPEGFEAKAPPSARDDVRLLVVKPGSTIHTRFSYVGDFLSDGDLVVVNTSATLPAAVEGTRHDGRPVLVHFASALDDGMRVVELRPGVDAVGPVEDARPGEVVALPGGAHLVLLAPYPVGQQRLWRAKVEVEIGVARFLARYGQPIRYAYVAAPVPLEEYQTVFAREPGSAEMPSAGRPFTAELVTDLVTRGIAVAPITLHTGLSSPELGEPPQPERYRVPISTARAVNATRSAGGRVVAIGTSVTRALESATDAGGSVNPTAGWTDLVLGPQRRARVVNGLVTGWHAPHASHLALLEAVAGPGMVESAYREALHAHYRWHEFGDSCLLLP